MTYEQAKQKVLGTNNNFDTVIEYESAWIFYNSKKEGAAPLVVSKKDGKVMTYSDYALTTNDSAEPVKKARKI